jgi:hypothetical protein
LLHWTDNVQIEALRLYTSTNQTGTRWKII